MSLYLTGFVVLSQRLFSTRYVTTQKPDGHPKFFPMLGVLILIRIALWISVSVLSVVARQVGDWISTRRVQTGQVRLID